MKNTKSIGNLTELQCITYLYSIGCGVNIPFGDAEKYDLVIEYNHKLYKVQIKHGNSKTDPDTGEIVCLSIRTTRQEADRKTRKRYDPKDVDFFGTYYEGKCYLIPFFECSEEKRLRIIPPKNNQIKGISYLKDYLAETILDQLN